MELERQSETAAAQTPSVAERNSSRGPAYGTWLGHVVRTDQAIRRTALASRRLRPRQQLVERVEGEEPRVASHLSTAARADETITRRRPESPNSSWHKIGRRRRERAGPKLTGAVLLRAAQQQLIRAPPLHLKRRLERVERRDCHAPQRRTCARLRQTSETLWGKGLRHARDSGCSPAQCAARRVGRRRQRSTRGARGRPCLLLCRQSARAASAAARTAGPGRSAGRRPARRASASRRMWMSRADTGSSARCGPHQQDHLGNALSSEPRAGRSATPPRTRSRFYTRSHTAASSASSSFQMTAKSVDCSALASSRVPRPRVSSPETPSIATTCRVASR